LLTFARQRVRSSARCSRIKALAPLLHPLDHSVCLVAPLPTDERADAKSQEQARDGTGKFGLVVGRAAIIGIDSGWPMSLLYPLITGRVEQATTFHAPQGFPDTRGAGASRSRTMRSSRPLSRMTCVARSHISWVWTSSTSPGCASLTIGPSNGDQSVVGKMYFRMARIVYLIDVVPSGEWILPDAPMSRLS